MKIVLRPRHSPGASRTTWSCGVHMESTEADTGGTAVHGYRGCQTRKELPMPSTRSTEEGEPPG